jgi:drug/metabolite transporter (DMT)-like permease
MTGGAGPFAVLLLLGLGWGLTQPLTKIAVSTGHGVYGLIFWQLAIAVVVLGPVALWRRAPLTRAGLVMSLVIALVGTLLPSAASYTAARHLPAGVMSIVLSLVPMLAFPVALMLGTDRFSLLRLAGLAVGLLGVALIALPEASLPDRAMVAALPIALIAPMFYAIEGNAVSRWGAGGLDAISLLFWASLFGAGLALIPIWTTGQWVDPRAGIGRAEQALIVESIIHAFVYSGYVWLVGRAGAVFAAQVSYLVTAFGVIWAMILLGERYSFWVWAAFGVMLVGLTLVSPRAPAPRALREVTLGDPV